MAVTHCSVMHTKHLRCVCVFLGLYKLFILLGVHMKDPNWPALITVELIDRPTGLANENKN